MDPHTNDPENTTIADAMIQWWRERKAPGPVDGNGWVNMTLVNGDLLQFRLMDQVFNVRLVRDDHLFQYVITGLILDRSYVPGEIIQKMRRAFEQKLRQTRYYV